MEHKEAHVLRWSEKTRRFLPIIDGGVVYGSVVRRLSFLFFFFSRINKSAVKTFFLSYVHLIMQMWSVNYFICITFMRTFKLIKVNFIER
jgi:hypothetical protein